jgi:acyl-coenzyme A thioesterase PaaI-like protein
VVGKLFGSMSPHMRRLGYEVISMRDGVGVGKVPYSSELVGDPRSGVLHGGVVT